MQLEYIFWTRNTSAVSHSHVWWRLSVWFMTTCFGVYKKPSTTKTKGGLTVTRVIIDLFSI